MSYEIDQILKHHKIRDYLASKSIYPHNPGGSGTYLYNCPLPTHNDKTPSFVVYDKGDKDDFFCFGCKKQGTIVNIYAALEGISFKEAVIRLSDGLKISSSDHLDTLIDEIINKETEPFNKDEILEVAFQINDCMYRFLKRVNFDSEELEICERFFYKLDEIVYFGMFKEVKNIRQLLPDYIEKRSIVYLNKKEKEKIQDISEKKAFKEIT